MSVEFILQLRVEINCLFQLADVTLNAVRNDFTKLECLVNNLSHYLKSPDFSTAASAAFRVIHQVSFKREILKQFPDLA